ncbi:MAG: LysO family transporter [Firmicutes bacterium]|nr:LysO family transporter [Bacillota bacterium]
MDIESLLMLCLYILMILTGYVIGHCLKKKNKNIKWVYRLQTAAIIAMVLLMGVRIGMNREIAGSFGTIGAMSFVFTLMVMAGSVLAVHVSRKLLGIDRRGQKSND